MHKTSESREKSEHRNKIYLNANIQFEQTQSKSGRKQELFECESRVWRESITKSEHEINESCSQIERPRSGNRKKNSPYYLQNKS